MAFFSGMKQEFVITNRQGNPDFEDDVLQRFPQQQSGSFLKKTAAVVGAAALGIAAGNAYYEHEKRTRNQG